MPLDKNHSSPRIFYGWWIVAVSMIGISTGTGPFAFASLGLFMVPFENEFGWSRTAISLCTTILVFTTALSLPVIGRFVDKVGSKRILLLSMVALALCLAAIPLFVSAVWELMVVFVLIGTVAAGTNSVPYMPVLSSWFDRRRGLAIGISIAGIGLGYAYVPLLVQFMVDHYGWRSGYYALAAIVIFIAAPLVLLVFRDTPAEMGLKPDGQVEGEAPKSTSKNVGLTVPEILRHREFWILVAVFIVLSFVLNGMLAHLVPMLIDRGMDGGTAASVAAVEGTTVFFSRIVIGYLVDRIFAPFVAIVFFTLSAVGILLFALGAIDGMAFLAAVMVGLSLGAEVDLLAYLTGRYFGLRSYGTTYGMLFSAVLIGTATGPLAFGLGFDLSGSYDTILFICVGVNLLAVVLTALLGRYPDWESRPETPEPGAVA